ncbi:MAG: crossover junction endodeoxyribonuclease RuvC [Chloroflexi bacterium RBG_16_54_18]|nr:MAG: crossover junction endodeoxyribonuclease RuvC [Chloroflexi bacterium RBG_16_54_18]
MLVIGIDPGTASTGFGLVREDGAGNLSPVDYGVIQTLPGQSMPERLLSLYHEIQHLLTLHRPEISAVEKLFFQRNVRTAMAVGQGRGVVLLALAEAGIPVKEYTPSEVKQAISGYGSAEKKQVQQMVKLLLNLKTLPQPDDAADGLALAICCLHSRRMQALVEEG